MPAATKTRFASLTSIKFTNININKSDIRILEATFYNWKKKYGGLGVSELRRLKQLEEENRQLKKLVADLSLDKQMLQGVLAKKL